MKLTQSQLRQIIREEIMRLNESKYGVDVYGPRQVWTKSVGTKTLGQGQTVDDMVVAASKKHGGKPSSTNQLGGHRFVNFQFPSRRNALLFINDIALYSDLKGLRAKYNGDDK